MSRINFGRTLVIANPVARSGEGEEGAKVAEEMLLREKSVSEIEIKTTSAPGDGRAMAKAAADFDTIIAIGGDGVIHEVVNGLMELPEDARPALGIIPLGSGNDYARTLAIPKNDPKQSVLSLLTGRVRELDIGHVTSDMDSAGTYYMQTLSFGLDAAIALDTSDRRAQGTAQKGASLFATSGIRIFSSYSEGWAYTARFDDESLAEGRSIIFACQIGPTYGGGFRVTPEATPTDGLINVCYSTYSPPVPLTLALFGLARFGLHARSRAIQQLTARHIHVEFAEEPPCQADGEKFRGTIFDVVCIPGALRVIVPPEASFEH